MKIENWQFENSNAKQWKGVWGIANFRALTGGVYKTRERIHRGVLTHGY